MAQDKLNVYDIYPKKVVDSIVKAARIKGRTGPSPPILGKGGPMKDKTKYNRKEKHSVRDKE